MSSRECVNRVATNVDELHELCKIYPNASQKGIYTILKDGYVEDLFKSVTGSDPDCDCYSLDEYTWIDLLSDIPDEIVKMLNLRIVEKILDKALDDESYDKSDTVIKIFARIYRQRLLTCAFKGEFTLFRFIDHGWSSVPDPEAHLGNVLKNSFIIYLTNLNNKYQEIVDDLIDKAINVDTTKRRIINGLMKELSVSQFAKRVTTYTNKIRFLNGVYDLENDEFRHGKPSDFIMQTTGIKYDPACSDVGVLDFLSRIYPDEGVLDYFKTFLATVLLGHNEEKHFQMFTGRGDNGKSALILLLQKALGGYMTTIPPSIFSSFQSNPDACTNALNTLKGALLAVASEPNVDTPVNPSAIKLLTGNDIVKSRELYDSAKPMKITCKFINVCNRPAPVPNGDRAFWERIVVVPFESTFATESRAKELTINHKRYVELAAGDSVPENPHIHTKIFNIESTFDKLAPALMNLAINRYRSYKHNMEVVLPKRIKAEISILRGTLDVVTAFMTDNLKSDESYVSMSSVYDSFKEWLAIKHPNERVMSERALISDIKSTLSSNYCISDDSKTLFGWTFK